MVHAARSVRGGAARAGGEWRGGCSGWVPRGRAKALVPGRTATPRGHVRGTAARPGQDGAGAPAG